MISLKFDIIFLLKREACLTEMRVVVKPPNPNMRVPLSGERPTTEQS
jgi:hypothetical protein